MQMIENTLNNEAFNFLRTEHELGYVALASIISAEQIDGIIIAVQGSAKTPPEMDYFIEQFLFKITKYFKNIGDQEFEMIKQGCLSVMTEKEKQLEDLSNLYFEEIKSQSYDFERKNKTI